jgi:UDP-N-acetylmuramyl tripeptide synthase
VSGRGGGTAIRGLVALRIDPHYVTRALNELDRLVLITGTNGKTTTTALLAAALRANGRRMVTNATGSNLERGLASVVAARARWDGRIAHADRTVGVFEADEWAFASLLPRLRPRVVVLLNLFRDQLDRYGEVDRTAEAWRTTLRSLSPTATVVANADDPVIVATAQTHPGPVRYFGLDAGPARAELDDWADVRRCPLCDRRLVYTRVAYGHLGHYRCESGDLQRPQPDVRVVGLDLQGLAGSRLELESGGRRTRLEVRLPGLFNAYNIVAAMATAEALELDRSATARALADTDPVFGRAEVIAAPETELILLLVKNPAGANQMLDLLALEPEPLDTLLLLNDGVADGEDISWIWDVDFERLKVRRLTVGGRRAQDMALRLKYAGVHPAVDRIRVVPGIAAPLDAALQASNGRIAVLTTYTAMLDLRAECTRRGWAAPYWTDGP